MRKLLRNFGVVHAAALLFTAVANAQPYPSKPVHVIVPAAPGGANTIIARILADRLQTAMGQPFLVENRGGAGGVVGANAVAKATPDGYTLLLTFGGPIATGLAMLQSVPYDAGRDFAPISRTGDVPLAMVASPKFGPQTVKDLVDYAKMNPGKVTASINSLGTMGHLLTEQFRLVTKVDLNLIPYKGSGPALVDLLGGQIDIAVDTVPAVLSFIKAGRLRPLAVATATRFDLLPDVPTFTEQGLAGLEVTTWFALLAPAGTPKDIIKRLNEETVKILNLKEVKELMAATGTIARGSTPEELGEYMRAETEKWAKIIKAAGIKAE